LRWQAKSDQQAETEVKFGDLARTAQRIVGEVTMPWRVRYPFAT